MSLAHRPLALSSNSDASPDEVVAAMGAHAVQGIGCVTLGHICFGTDAAALARKQAAADAATTGAVALCSNHFLYLGLNKIIERGHMLLHETQKMW